MLKNTDLKPRPKIPIRLQIWATERRKYGNRINTSALKKQGLKTQKNAFFERGIWVIPVLLLILTLVSAPLYAKGKGKVIRYSAVELSRPLKKHSSILSKVFSHLTVGGGITGTWGVTNGASLFVKKENQVEYTGSNPSVEFDTTEGWKSNYTFYGGFVGAKFGWFSIGGAYESFKMAPGNDRFILENTAHGIAVSLPTVSLKGSVVSVRAEIDIAPHGPLSPFIAVSYPLSHNLKSLSYNSDPEPVEIKNEAYTIYGVNVTPYENKDIPAEFSPAVEVGFSIRLKGRVRLRATASYRQMRWHLFYHEHRDEIIVMGFYLGI